jgi:6-phosphogluconate dehydrogenase
MPIQSMGPLKVGKGAKQTHWRLISKHINCMINLQSISKWKTYILFSNWMDAQSSNFLIQNSSSFMKGQDQKSQKRDRSTVIAKQLFP